jgi:hypothetical protein
MSRTLFPLLLLLGTTVAAVPATAQVRRCVAPDGAVVFTDHQCAELGAEERAPARPQVAGNRHAYKGCARTVEDLMFEMTTAFDTHDPNRLAGVYHWTGMAGSTAYSILDKLDTMVQRPLVDLVPVMPSPPVDVAVSDPGAAVGAPETGAPETDANYYPQASVRREPVAVRVEQTLANGITPSRTVFGLRRHLGCWWVQL